MRESREFFASGGKMCSKMQQFFPVVAVAAMLLAAAVVMPPTATAANGAPYLDIIEGQVLWQESIAGDEVAMSAQLVGDLDGDGLPDVMVGSSVGPSENQTYTIIAKKGGDGSHLWEESVSGEAANMVTEVVGDLDGNGLPDILVHSSVGPYDDQTATVIAKTGNNGTHLWEESITGYGAYIEAHVVGDLDGDGLPDVLVDNGAGESPVISAAIAVKGSDGTHLWEESVTGAGVYTYIYGEAVADLNGDGLPDVLVSSEVGPYDNVTSNLTAKTGNNGTHLWEESLTGYEAYISPNVVEDLNGDGLPDVLVGSFAGPDDNITATVIAKTGINGTHLWEESVSGPYAGIDAQMVGDLDGDSLPDVLVRSFVGPGDNITAAVIAKTGNNGTHLWEEPISGYEADMSTEVVGDLDGDGLPDILVSSEVGPYDNVTSNLTAKKGSNGNHLWQESVSGEAANMVAEVVGDLDGDGLPDVMVHSYVGAYDNGTQTVIAKTGVSGTHLWEEFASGGYNAGIYAEVVEDLDGDGLPDVLVRSFTGPVDNQTCALIAKKGSDGTHLWEESVNGYSAIVNYEVVGDLDGDGLPNILVSTRVGVGTLNCTLIAKKMSDGAHLWEESITGDSADIEAYAVPDLDGDGLPDVLVQTSEGASTDRTFTVIAKKGINGTHLWEESVSGDNSYTDIQAAQAAADFDGDGLPDVLVQSRTGSAEENQTYTAIGKKGSDGTHLWEAESNEEISFASGAGEQREPLFPDLNGDGKADALLWVSNQVCAVSVVEEAPPSPPSLPAAVPTVTPWGMIGMIAAFSLLLAWMTRRRLAADKGRGKPG
jgi:hypothetical protein